MFKRKERNLGKVKILSSFFVDLRKGAVYDYYLVGKKMYVETEQGFDIEISHPTIDQIVKYEILK